MTSQVAYENLPLSRLPNIESTMFRAFAVLVSRLISSVAQETDFAIKKAPVSLDIVETQVRLSARDEKD